MTEDQKDNSISGQDWDVFICYRQVDGSETADWLHQHLQNQPMPTAEYPPPRIRFYVDRYTAAVTDWRKFNQDALMKARAMIIVCTPGSLIDEGPEDEVQKEIRWWVSNRATAPIIIDATGQGVRYVPTPIRDQWPNAQMVQLQTSGLAKEEPDKRALAEERVVRRITEGILASEGQVRDEDLERTRQLQAKTASALRRTSIALAFAIVTLVVAVFAAIGFVDQKNEATFQAKKAEDLRQTADLAWLGGQNLDASRTTEDAEIGALLVLEALNVDSQSLQAQLAFAHVLEYYPPLIVDHWIPEVSKAAAGSVSSFSPDGRFFGFSEEISGQLTVLDLSTGSVVFEFGGLGARISAITFDFQSTLMAAGDENGKIYIFEVPSWKTLRTLDLEQPVQTTAFVAHGRELLAGGTMRGVNAWSVGSWKSKSLFSDSAGDTMSFHFSPDGQWIVTKSWQSQIEENIVRIRDRQTGQTVSYIQGDPFGIALSNDGWFLAVNGCFHGSGEYCSSEVRLFQFQVEAQTGAITPSHVASYAKGTRGAVLAFDPLARQLAIGGDKIGVSVLSTPGGRHLAKIDQYGVHTIAYLRNGSALAAAGSGRVQVWDFDVGRSLARNLTKENYPYFGEQFEQNIRTHIPGVKARIGRELSSEETSQYIIQTIDD